MLTSERVDEAWTPQTFLLFTLVDHQYADAAPLQNHRQLLDYYRQVAQGLDQLELVQALALQLSAFDHFFDWETMLKAFAEAAVAQPTRQALFASWRDYIIRRAKPYTWNFGWSQPRETTWWLHWLIDSVVDPQKGPAWFQGQMSRWLAQLPSEQRALGEAFEFLRLLTKDLTEISGNKKQYPKFYEIVIRPNEWTSPDQASRRAYLKQSAQPDLLAQVMAYWQAHLQNFVPKPEQAHKSDYTSHAQWMAALRELAPDSYTTLLEKWRGEHHRRRNLWAAMGRLGLG